MLGCLKKGMSSTAILLITIAVALLGVWTGLLASVYRRGLSFVLTFGTFVSAILRKRGTNDPIVRTNGATAQYRRHVGAAFGLPLFHAPAPPPRDPARSPARWVAPKRLAV